MGVTGPMGSARLVRQTAAEFDAAIGNYWRFVENAQLAPGAHVSHSCVQIHAVAAQLAHTQLAPGGFLSGVHLAAWGVTDN